MGEELNEAATCFKAIKVSTDTWIIVEGCSCKPSSLLKAPREEVFI